jgi:hypothetical protein
MVVEFLRMSDGEDTVDSGIQYFCQTYGAVLAVRMDAGFHQGHGFEVVFAADFGGGIFLNRAHQLGHGARKGVGEPYFLPAGFMPLARVL